MTDRRPDSTTFDWSSSEEEARPVDARPRAVEVGDTVGGFRVLGRIGQGGMGTVWEAEQAHPRRIVALKTITPDRVSKGAARRFRYEAEALGQVLHWGIPQVYAAGDDAGRLFIAMERVHGVTLDRWAETASREQRVDMLIAICEAVHHAHLRGIVHRDLKPANILVTEQGRPKVLDFGIAQMRGGSDTGEIVGTPAYVSPEQLSGQGVDVRADVWSLGVIAYELLCGRLPITIEGRSAIQVVWALQSERVVTLGERDRSLRGDLSAIVARALERDRELRYPSVEALGADLRRHVEHFPVEARPPSAPYVAGRWLQRHLGLVAATVAFVLALETGLVFAFEAYLDAERARSVAVEQRRLAESARRRAELQRRRSDHITAFLTDLLSQAHPDQSVGREVTVVEVLDRAVARVESGDLGEEPGVEQAIRVVLANALVGLGRDAEALPVLEGAVALREAVGPSDDGVEAALFLADRLRGRGDARSLELVEAARRDLEALHPPPDARWRGYHHTLGRIHLAAGRYPQAEAELRRATELAAAGAEDDDPAASWNQLGHALVRLGRLDEAEALFRRSLAYDEERYGPDHPQTATDLANLAEAATLGGRPDEAVSLASRALSLRTGVLGPDHRRTRSARGALVEALLGAGRPREAERELAELEAPRDGEPTTPPVHELRAEVDRARGRPDSAAAHAEAALAGWTEARGAEHPYAAVARGLVGRVALARGERAGAAEQLAAARALLLERVGPDGPDLRPIDAALAELGAGPE